MLNPIETFAPGDPLIMQREPVGFAWRLEEGEVELREDLQPLRRAEIGEIIGADMLLEESLSPYDAIALTETKVRRITLKELQDMQAKRYASQQKEAQNGQTQPVVKAMMPPLPAAEPMDTHSFLQAAGTAKPMPTLPPSVSKSVPLSLAATAAGNMGGGDGLAMLAQAIANQTAFMQKHMKAAETELDIIEKERKVLTSDFINKMADLGPITPLMHDDEINDILINGHNTVYIERRGKLEKTDIQLSGEQEVLTIAKRIAAGINREINPFRPLLDARLADGSRVNIICPPLAVDGTSISIRKFSKRLITIDDMVNQQNMSKNLGEFLKVAGRCRMNVLISGGTGSGKTTLLNAVSQYIDHGERIVTIEDAAELKLDHPDLVRLETRPSASKLHMESEVSMRDLVKNALRMRPDRIIVGEVRGHEAFDMMQAMNTGHEGSLTTVHANHPRDALSRLENMIGMANLHIPVAAMRYQIAAALHLIIQVSRQRDGHRRITHVTEIIGMEGDTITMNDLFNFKPKGEDDNGMIYGEFAWSGIMPRCVRRVAYYGELGRLEAALGVKIPLKNH